MADHSLLFSPPELVGGDVEFWDLADETTPALQPALSSSSSSSSISSSPVPASKSNPEVSAPATEVSDASVPAPEAFPPRDDAVQRVVSETVNVLRDAKLRDEQRKECRAWKVNRFYQMKLLFQNLYELGYLTTAIDTGFSTQTDGNKSCLNFSRELDILIGWTDDILCKAMPLKVWEDEAQFPKASPVFWAIDLTRQLLADRTDNQGVFQVQESHGGIAHPERWSRQSMWELLKNFAGDDVYSSEGQMQHSGPRGGELRNIQRMVVQGPKHRQLRIDALGDEGHQRAKAETLALLFKRATGREMAEGIVGGGEPNVFRFPNARRNHAVAERLHTTEGADETRYAKVEEKKELKGKMIDYSKIPGADELRLKLIAERDARRRAFAPSSVSSTVASISSTTSSITAMAVSSTESSSGTDKASNQSNVVRLEAGGKARMREERKREREAAKLERQLEKEREAKLEEAREAEKMAKAAEDKALLREAERRAKETENELHQVQAHLHRVVSEEAAKLEKKLFQLEQPDTYSCRQTAPLKLSLKLASKTMPPKVKTFVDSEKGTILFRNVEQRERPERAAELVRLRKQAEFLLTLRDDLEVELQKKEKLWSQERAYGPNATQRRQQEKEVLQAGIADKLAKLNKCWEQMCKLMPPEGKEMIEAACAMAMAPAGAFSAICLQLQGAPPVRCEALPVHPVTCWVAQCRQERIEQLELKSQLAKVKTTLALRQLQLKHVSRPDSIAQAKTRVQCGRLGVRPATFSDAVRVSVGEAAAAPVRREVKSAWDVLIEAEERSGVLTMSRPVSRLDMLRSQISQGMELVPAAPPPPPTEFEPQSVKRALARQDIISGTSKRRKHMPVAAQAAAFGADTPVDVVWRLKQDISLRPHQQRGLAAILQCEEAELPALLWEGGSLGAEAQERMESGVCELACGSGKTLMIIASTVALKDHVLVVTTAGLLSQMKEDLLQFSTICEQDVIVCSAERGDEQKGSWWKGKSGGPHIIITSYSYLAARANNIGEGGLVRQLYPNFAKLLDTRFSLMLCDEAHRAPSSQAARALNSLSCATRIGMSGSLFREENASTRANDGRDKILEFFGGRSEALCTAGVAELIAGDYIAKPSVFQTFPSLPKEWHHEFYLDDQHTTMRRRLMLSLNPESIRRVQMLVEEMRLDGQAAGERRKAIIFVDHVWTLLEVARLFDCLYIYGDVDAKEREVVLGAFVRGALTKVDGVVDAAGVPLPPTYYEAGRPRDVPVGPDGTPLWSSPLQLVPASITAAGDEMPARYEHDGRCLVRGPEWAGLVDSQTGLPVSVSEVVHVGTADVLVMNDVGAEGLNLGAVSLICELEAPATHRSLNQRMGRGFRKDNPALHSPEMGPSAAASTRGTSCETAFWSVLTTTPGGNEMQRQQERISHLQNPATRLEVQTVNSQHFTALEARALSAVQAATPDASRKRKRHVTFAVDVTAPTRRSRYTMPLRRSYYDPEEPVMAPEQEDGIEASLMVQEEEAGSERHLELEEATQEWPPAECGANPPGGGLCDVRPLLAGAASGSNSGGGGAGQGGKAPVVFACPPSKEELLPKSLGKRKVMPIFETDSEHSDGEIVISEHSDGEIVIPQPVILAVAPDSLDSLDLKHSARRIETLLRRHVECKAPRLPKMKLAKMPVAGTHHMQKLRQQHKREHAFANRREKNMHSRK